MKEIERKFLIEDASLLENLTGKAIAQGYLSIDPERAVRVRISDDKGFLTVKGKSNQSGTTRFEWEKEIDLSEAEELLKLCLPTVISKTRFTISQNDFVWEIDVFHADNAGLILAEIELESEDQKFDRPDWIGNEVTGDKRYYNAYLSQHPFKSWK